MKRYAGLRVCTVLAALAILGVTGVAEADFVIILRNGSEIKVSRYEEAGNQIVYERYGGKITIPKTRVVAIKDLRTGEKRILNRPTESKATPRGKTAKRRKRLTLAHEKSPKTLRQGSELDMFALTQELQKHSRTAGEATMVMWLPEEFWRASMAQNPTASEAQIEQLVKLIRRYTFIMAVDGTHGPLGGVTYRSEADIRAHIQLRNSNGTFYRPLSEHNIDADTKILLSMFKPVLVNTIGPLGRNTHFFLFPSKNMKGRYIAQAKTEGAFTVRLGEREFSWRLPLSSLVSPKICPVDGEKMSGAWKFCPWHGTKLLSGGGSQQVREN